MVVHGQVLDFLKKKRQKKIGSGESDGLVKHHFLTTQDCVQIIFTPTMSSRNSALENQDIALALKRSHFSM